VALEGAAAAPAVVEPLMRAAHSLKGAARIVGLDAAVRVAHAMEDCFVAAQKGQIVLHGRCVDILLQGVDLLAMVARIADAEVNVWQTEQSAEIDALIEALSAVKAGRVPPLDVVSPAESPASGVAPTPSVTGRFEREAVLSSPTGADDNLVDAAAGAKEPAPERTDTHAVVPLSAGNAPAEIHGREQPVPVPAASDRERESDRVVRVTADSLSRLMGLASEALVQTHRFPPLVNSLWQLKGRQTRLLESLQVLEDRVSGQRAALPAAERELLAKVKSQASRDLQLLGEMVEAIVEFARVSEEVSSRLYHEVLASRMRPLTEGIRGFPRLVRDLARELGKQARFEVVGENTGVDRDILDRLEAPLNHLIRNALDHGLEVPEERRAAGKLPSGTIRLEARHRAGMLQISLSDDGRGVDLEQLRAKVIEHGLASEAMAARLSETELLDFLFLPGFSTKEGVTEVSGRGVGLDVVQNMVHAVRGSVRITSQPGKGTRFILQLPITISVIRALLVEIAGEPYAFPLNRIDRILMLDRKDLRELEGKHFTMVDDQPVGLVEAALVLELATSQVRPAGEPMPVVIASDRSHRFGVVVDRYLGERDLRVSPLDTRLGKVPDINSSSILESGSPVLVIDVEDLIRSIDNLLAGRRIGRLGADGVAHQSRAPKRVLIVDDSVTVRELERQLLESRGYKVDTAVDGIDGWNAVRSTHYDLVVSDVDMPRMDGIELIRHIRQDRRLKATPVVIVSYKDREEDRIRGLDAGADSYLTKSSFHDRTFLSTVADLIGEPLE
jgi:two-component system sensor histidine kinase and response regulator WspE